MWSKKKKSDTFSSRPFENLKKIIQQKGMVITPKETVRNEQIPTTDAELFVDAMSKVREIREFRDLPVYSGRKKSIPVKKDDDSTPRELKILCDIVSGKKAFHLPDTQEYVEWVSPDYARGIAENLHGGHYSVQDCIDLHGCTVQEAEIEVELFLKNALKKRLNCVKIIHGRGLRSPRGPVLKESLIKLLSRRYRKNIASFVTARQCDGGLGAVYILLRQT